MNSSKFSPVFKTDTITPVIVSSGLVLYTHKSLFVFIYYIKSTFKVNRVPVYIHTWDFDNNNRYLDELLTRLNKIKFVDVKLIHQKYDDNGVIEFMKNVWYSPSGSAVIPKSFLSIFSLFKVTELVNKDISNAYIFKIRSKVKYSNLNSFKLLDNLNLGLEDIQHLYFFEDLSNIEFKDVIFSRRTSEYGFDEITFNCSVNSILNVLGDSIDELTKRLNNISIRVNQPNYFFSINSLQDIDTYSGPLILGALSKFSLKKIITGTLRLHFSHCLDIGIQSNFETVNNPNVTFDFTANKAYVESKELLMSPTVNGFLL